MPPSEQVLRRELFLRSSQGGCHHSSQSDPTPQIEVAERAERKSSRLQEPAGTPQPYERLRLKGVALPFSKSQAPNSASMTRSLCIGLATRRTT